jgi:hypothetical protein
MAQIRRSKEKNTPDSAERIQSISTTREENFYEGLSKSAESFVPLAQVAQHAPSSFFRCDFTELMDKKRGEYRQEKALHFDV